MKEIEVSCRSMSKPAAEKPNRYELALVMSHQKLVVTNQVSSALRGRPEADQHLRRSRVLWGLGFTKLMLVWLLEKSQRKTLMVLS